MQWIFLIINICAVQITAQNFSVGIVNDIGYWNRSLEDSLIISNTKLLTNSSISIAKFADVYEYSGEVCQLLKSGVTGIITFVDCSVAEYMELFGSLHDLPLIQFVSTECDFHTSLQGSLKLIPSCVQRNRALKEIVKYMEWKEIVIVLDSMYDSYCILDLMERISESAVSVRLVSFNETDPYTGVLRKIHDPMAQTNIICLVSDTHIQPFLQQAATMGMFSSSYYWIIYNEKASLEDFDLPGFYSGFVVTVSQVASSDTGSRTCTHREDGSWTKMNNLFLMDATEIFAEAFLNTNLSFSFPLNESATFDCDTDDHILHGNTLKNYMREMEIEGYTGDISWTSDGYLEKVDYEICSVMNDSYKNVGFQRTATYRSHLPSLSVIDERMYLNEFKDFGNRTIRVVSVPAVPFNVKNVVNNETFYYTGFCYDILNEFATQFNFRYRTVESIDGTYGGPSADRTDGTGMVGMVMRGEADIGVAPFTVTAVRDAVVDFLTPFQEEGVGIIMRKPDPNANRKFKMFLPFQYSVWCTIIGTIAIVGILQYAVHRLSPYNKRKLKLRDALWLSFGAYVGQGGESSPAFPSGRVIMGIWWMFTIVMLALYTANLAAFLTVTLTKTPIKNIAELSAQAEYKPLVKEGTNLVSLFKNADGGTYAKIWSMMSNMPKVKTAEEAYELTLNGPYAFMTDVSQLQYRALTDCQNLHIAEHTFNKAGLSFIVKENAPFLEAFNKHMIRMLETGLITKYRSNWWPANSACNAASYTTTADPVDLDSIAGLFFFYGGMIGLSIIIVVLEILIRKYFHKIYLFVRRKRKVTSSKENLNTDDE